jgi:hypothetical protein
MPLNIGYNAIQLTDLLDPMFLEPCTINKFFDTSSGIEIDIAALYAQSKLSQEGSPRP